MHLISYLIAFSILPYTTFAAPPSSSSVSPPETDSRSQNNILDFSFANTTLSTHPTPRQVRAVFHPAPNAGTNIVSINPIVSFLRRRRIKDQETCREREQSPDFMFYPGFNQHVRQAPAYHLVLQPKWAPELGIERQLSYTEAGSVYDQIETHLLAQGLPQRNGSSCGLIRL